MPSVLRLADPRNTRIAFRLQHRMHVLFLAICERSNDAAASRGGHTHARTRTRTHICPFTSRHTHTHTKYNNNKNDLSYTRELLTMIIMSFIGTHFVAAFFLCV